MVVDCDASNRGLGTWMNNVVCCKATKINTGYLSDREREREVTMVFKKTLRRRCTIMMSSGFLWYYVKIDQHHNFQEKRKETISMNQILLDSNLSSANWRPRWYTIKLTDSVSHHTGFFSKGAYVYYGCFHSFIKSVCQRLEILDASRNPSRVICIILFYPRFYNM